MKRIKVSLSFHGSTGLQLPSYIRPGENKSSNWHGEAVLNSSRMGGGERVQVDLSIQTIDGYPPLKVDGEEEWNG